MKPCALRQWMMALALLLLMLLPAGCLSSVNNGAALAQVGMQILPLSSQSAEQATPEPAQEAQESMEQAPALGAPTPVVDQPSVLTLEGQYDVIVGNVLEWKATLQNLSGRPLPNKVLLIFVNDMQVRRIRTDENGQADIYLGRELPVGQHRVRVEAIATTAYRATTAEVEFTIRTSQLRLITVPPLPDIGFVFNGQTYYSDASGVAVIEQDTPGVYPLEILPIEQEPGEEPERIDFMRWGDNVFTPMRDVEVAGDKDLYVGLSRSYPISLRFVDRAGKPVDSSRIMSVTLKSSTGTRYVASTTGAEWRTANRIARLSNGLEATEVQYAVESVFVDGANVVNQNQQRFLVQGGDEWTVQLLLYAIQVRAKDALFGFPLGDGVNLRYPDGSLRYIPFNEDNVLVIDDLARGLYRLQVVGAAGMAPETPVAVSRDQVVELKVLSSLDIGLGAGCGLVAALGLLLIGRPGPLLWLLPGRRAGRRRGDRRRESPSDDYGKWLDPEHGPAAVEPLLDAGAVQRYEQHYEQSYERGDSGAWHGRRS